MDAQLSTKQDNTASATNTTLTISSTTEECIALTQPGTCRMLMTFRNSLSKTSGQHWAVGHNDNSNNLTFARRTSSGFTFSEKMKLDISGNLVIAGTMTSS
eukprot:14833623-Heterocapsa_arctica.AAC.1